MRFAGTYAVLVLSLLLIGCNRETYDSCASDEMAFRINTPDVMLTKGEISDENIESTAVVKVFESIVTSGPLYSGVFLNPEIVGGNYSGVWKPAGRPTWSSYSSENLSFYSYAYSPTSAEGNGLTINSKGYEIIVSQPDTYDPQNSIDFLMSNPVRVPTDMTKGKVIPLNLEHVMSKVELYVYCADAMTSNANQTIDIQIHELYIERIHTDLTMVYAPQSAVEKWTRKDYGPADVTYSRNDFVVNRKNHEDMSENLAFGFIAVPIDKLDMQARLYIRYSVNVNNAGPVEFSSYFDLKDYTPSGWKSNHKIKYELKIDTGISLTGKITDWVAVDYIEGVVLPEIHD